MELKEQRENAVDCASQLVRNLYEAKTASILHRYDPGPRIHYHTGFVDEAKLPTGPAAPRTRLVESQEQMLSYAARRSRSLGLEQIPFFNPTRSLSRVRRPACLLPNRWVQARRVVVSDLVGPVFITLNSTRESAWLARRPAGQASKVLAPHR